MRKNWLTFLARDTNLAQRFIIDCKVFLFFFFYEWIIGLFFWLSKKDWWFFFPFAILFYDTRGCLSLFCFCFSGKLLSNKNGSQVQVLWLSVCWFVLFTSWDHILKKETQNWCGVFAGASNKLIELRLFLFFPFIQMLVKTVKIRQAKIIFRFLQSVTF